MLNVYICEDNQEQRTTLEGYISDIIQESVSKDINIHMSAATPEDILDAVAQTDISVANTGIYFLDIELGTEMNGIELGRKLRKLDPFCFIVIITTYSQYMPQTIDYMLEPLAYILKDTPDDIKVKLQNCLFNAYTMYQNRIQGDAGNHTITFATRTMSHTYQYDEILYITLSHKKHTIEVNTEKGVHEFRGNISECVSRLPFYFFKLSRDTVINLHKVNPSVTDKDMTEAKDLKITMMDGTQFSISIRRLGQFHKMMRKSKNTS